MAPLDDATLDAYLAAEPLAQPPAELVARAARQLRAPVPPAAARQSWLDRLTEVAVEFRSALAQPPLALMAVTTRGDPDAATVSSADQAALAHTVSDGTLHGQVFVTALESPEGFEVELLRGDQTVDSDLSDATGRFEFSAVEPGEYELRVAELELTQAVRVGA